MSKIKYDLEWKGNPYTLTTQFVRVTPKMAQEWLKKNTRNRRLNDKTVSRYATDMASHEWATTHQGIAFYEDGILADGQTRLHSQIRANKTITWLVTTGIPVEQVYLLDNTRPRLPSQSFSMIEDKRWITKDIVAIAKNVAKIEFCSESAGTMTPPQLARYCATHREALEFASSQFRSKKKYLSTAAIKSAVACAFYHEQHEDLSSFAEILESGFGFSDGDRGPMLLRDHLLTHGEGAFTGGNRMANTRRTMRAIKAFCEREPLKVLRAPATFIYQPTQGESR